MTIQDYFGPRFGLGWLIALVVLIVAIVLLVVGGVTSFTLLVMIAGLALARLT